MSETNGGRPLPWADLPLCPACRTHTVVVVAAMANGHSGGAKARIACSACGVGRVGATSDLRRCERAESAYRRYLAGRIHPDRGCERCNGALLLDRQRLCASCVEKDNAERQVPLFPEARP